MAITRIGNIADTIPNSSVQNIKMSNIVQSKNIIINGDMSIAQRATSVSGLTGAGYHTVDRFQQYIASAGTWTISQSTEVPTGQGFATSLKWDCTTANSSLSSSSLLILQQIFEGQNLQYLKKGTSSAESLTASFWVKSNKTGTYICQFRDMDNSRSISQSYTISSANTWEKKIITVPGDTTGAFDNDNGDSLRLLFFLGVGSNYSSGTLQTTWGAEVTANRAVGQVNLADSTSNEWYVTGVQLEAGTTASEFEFLPFNSNLDKCQRYYYKAGYNPATDSDNTVTAERLLTGMRNHQSGSDAFFQIQTPSQMRTAPSVSYNNINIRIELTNYTISSIDGIKQFGPIISFTINASSTISEADENAIQIRFTGTEGYLAFSAEL